MARELNVSASQIGLLITIFAATVVVSTTPLTALTRHYSRKQLVVIVLLINATSGVLAALAPTFELLIGARILGGLAHGLFWAVVGAYSGHLVPRHQIGRAVAITSGGVTAAFVLGVPFGTLLGHALGWRLAFAAIGGMMMVLSVLVIRYLPAVDHRVTLATGEIDVPFGRDRSLTGVLIICSVIVVMMTGHNLFYTYIAPWLISIGRFSESDIAPLLFLFGGAGAVGLVLAAAVTERFPHRAFVAAAVTMALPVAALAFVAHNQIVVMVAIGVWGMVFGALPAMLQTRMLHTASARVRDIASALFGTSFNLAIGAGALLGGVLLDSYGVGTLPIVDLVILGASIVFITLTDSWLSRRAARPRLHPN